MMGTDTRPISQGDNRYRESCKQVRARFACKWSRAFIRKKGDMIEYAFTTFLMACAFAITCIGVAMVVFAYSQFREVVDNEDETAKGARKRHD